MNQLECMQMFVQVVEREGFSRAAITLQMSPAKVSTQISHLEAHLGVQLLSRTTRSCTLTDEGRAYYEHCKRIFADIADTEAGLATARTEPHGRLRIDASVTLINRLILPVIGRFHERYPDVELEFLHTEHLFDSRQDGMDVMFRLGPLEDSNLIARPLGRIMLVTAAAPAYLARRGTPKAPTDLTAHECINFLDPHTGRVKVWEFVRDNETLSITPGQGFSFNQGESRLAAAVMGLGIYRGLALSLDRLLQDGSLQLVLEDWTTPAPPIYVAHANHRNIPGKIRAFVEFMVECYPPRQCLVAPPARADLLQVPHGTAVNARAV
jgi:LysR family transcriptional regulator for bpeEF and oprC